jgi:hypothetical protein
MPTIPPIPLSTPIRRGDTEITTLQLRAPAAGELRGISLAALLQIDAGAVMQLLPRITTPPLTAPEISALDVCDLTACGLEIAAFLLPASMKPAPDFPTPNSDSPQP